MFFKALSDALCDTGSLLQHSFRTPRDVLQCLPSAGFFLWTVGIDSIEHV